MEVIVTLLSGNEIHLRAYAKVTESGTGTANLFIRFTVWIHDFLSIELASAHSMVDLFLLVVLANPVSS